MAFPANRLSGWVITTAVWNSIETALNTLETAVNAATTALTGKSPIGHTHGTAEISGLDTAIANAVTAANWTVNGVTSLRITASRSFVGTDVGKIVEVDSASDCVLTIPAGVFAGDAGIEVRRAGTGEVAVAAGAGTVIRSDSDPAELRVRSQWASIYVNKRATAASALITSGLSMRYRADDVSGADLAAVSSWPSAISGGPAAIQATTANQPKLRTNISGVHSAIEFDGSNDMLALQGVALDAFRNKTDAIVFVCYRLPTITTNTRSILALSTGTTAGARVSIQQNVNVSNIHQVGGRRLDADGSSVVATATVGSTAGEIAVLTAIYRWSVNDLFLIKNGTQIASNTSFQTTGSTSDTASLTGFIGANAAGTAEWYGGQIFEIMAFTGGDTDASLRANVHTYFHNTYGLTASPSDYLGPSDEFVVSGNTKI